MNVLIYSHVALWTVHHGKAIEIAISHIEKGDKVFMLSCMGDLQSCPANPMHELSKCDTCRVYTKYSVRKTLGRKVNNIILSLDSYGDLVDINTESSYSTFNELRAYKYKGVPLGALVMSQLVDDLSDCFADLSDMGTRINNLLNNGRALYLEARRQINDNKINKVYVWNGRRISDGPVCYAAKDEGVDFEVYISGTKFGTYMKLPALTVQDLDEHKANITKLVERSKNGAEIDYLRAEGEAFYSIQRYGGEYFPGFVHFAKKFSNDEILKKQHKKNMVIFTSSFWEFFSLDKFSCGVYSDHYSGINQIIHDERIKSEYVIVVRWHPNLKNCGSSEFAIIQEVVDKSHSCDDLIHYLPDSNVDSYALMDAADVVVTFGSTIGIEACFYGKPSILLGRIWYEDLNVCYKPKTHEDLVGFLSKDLLPLSREDALVYGCYMRNMGNHSFEHLSISSDYLFTYHGKQLTPLTLRGAIRKSLPKSIVSFLKVLRDKLNLTFCMVKK
jgi:hypothetical protein